jgi:hypothetical protein
MFTITFTKIEQNQTRHVIKVPIHPFQRELWPSTNLAGWFFDFYPHFHFFLLFCIFACVTEKIIIGNVLYTITTLMETGVTFITINHLIIRVVFSTETDFAICLKSWEFFSFLNYLLISHIFICLFQLFISFISIA